MIKKIQTCIPQTKQPSLLELLYIGEIISESKIHYRSTVGM